MRVHIPSPSRSQNGCRYRHGNLIVVPSGKLHIPNQNLQPLLNGRTSIKVEIGHMKEPMHLHNIGSRARSVFGFQMAITEKDEADCSVKGFFEFLVKIYSLRTPLRKMIKQYRQVVLDHHGNRIAVPFSRTKAIGIHPQHVLVWYGFKQERMVPNIYARLEIWLANASVGNWIRSVNIRTFSFPRETMFDGCGIAPLDESALLLWGQTFQHGTVSKPGWIVKDDGQVRRGCNLFFNSATWYSRISSDINTTIS
jgi:hypothetical protein